MTFNGVVGGLEPVSTYQYLRLPICVLLMWCSSTDQNCVSTGERDFWVVGGLEQISLCPCLFVCVLLMLCNPINPDPKSSGERDLGLVRGLKSVSTCLRFPTCVLLLRCNSIYELRVIRCRRPKGKERIRPVFVFRDVFYRGCAIP